MGKKERKVKDEKKVKTPKGKSKFSNKYSDRIASIREADEKARIKTQREQIKKHKKNTNKRTSIETSTMAKTKKIEEKKNVRPKSARGMRRNTQTINKEIKR